MDLPASAWSRWARVLPWWRCAWDRRVPVPISAVTWRVAEQCRPGGLPPTLPPFVPNSSTVSRLQPRAWPVGPLIAGHVVHLHHVQARGLVSGPLHDLSDVGLAPHARGNTLPKTISIETFMAVVYLAWTAGCAAGSERPFAVALINTALAMAPVPTIIAPTAKATENPCTTAYGASRGPRACDVVGRSGGSDGVEEGGAQGRTDLLGRIDHRTGDARVSLTDLGQGGTAQSREGQTEPKAHDDLLGKEVGPVRRVHPDLGQPQQTQGGHDKASGDGDARSDLGQQVRCRPGGHDHAEGERKEGHPGFGC